MMGINLSSVNVRQLAVLGACSVTLLFSSVRASGEILNADLNVIRSLAEGDWFRLKLELLGLRLSYPAYRIHLRLNEENVVSFNFWISTPLAEHLEQAGRGESERVLAYHADGISSQVSTLVREDFPEMWPAFDLRSDLKGVFLVPGDEFDSLPEEIAVWERNGLRLLR
ncbi:MAG: hypothetical protein O3B84_08225 [Chloroflexi bacterium]|nr:hypothetical protein [Chloroflexota bacterium]